MRGGGGGGGAGGGTGGWADGGTDGQTGGGTSGGWEDKGNRWGWGGDRGGIGIPWIHKNWDLRVKFTREYSIPLVI